MFLFFYIVIFYIISLMFFIPNTAIIYNYTFIIIFINISLINLLFDFSIKYLYVKTIMINHYNIFLFWWNYV